MADLTKEIAGTPSEQAIDIPVERAQQRQAEGKPQEPANADAIAPSDPPSPDPPSATDTPVGDASMWDKVSAADLERAKRVLASRRSELLARHAEELKALETEQAEIDVIEHAIAAFTKKFNPTPGAEVVPFGGERVPVEAG